MAKDYQPLPVASVQVRMGAGVSESRVEALRIEADRLASAA